MADAQWGNCKGCRHFASSNAHPDEAEVHECNQPELRRFALEVSGNSGCNAFEARTGVTSTYEEPAPALH